MLLKKLKYILILIISIICFISCNINELFKSNTIYFITSNNNPNNSNIYKEILSEFESKNDCKIEIINSNKNNLKNLIDSLKELEENIVLFLSTEQISDLKTNDISIKEIDDSLVYKSEIDTNNYIAYPYLYNPLMLYINMDLLNQNTISKKIPQTFSELNSICSEFPESDNFFPIGVAYNSINYLQYILLSNDSRINRINEFYYYNNSLLESYYYSVLLSKKGIVETQRQIESFFMNGKLGFCFADLSLINKINKNHNNLNFTTKELPTINNNKIIPANYYYFIIDTHSKNHELLSSFIKFISETNTYNRIINNIPYLGFAFNKTTKLLRKELACIRLNSNNLIEINKNEDINIQKVLLEAHKNCLYSKKSVEMTFMESHPLLLRNNR